ncbi:hypothetical protein [Xanthomonas campestris]|uniref:hypothetical protein n=1 Tax=Xanthomonas campestris TaxID=339 RepID=UPI0015F27580|nr:hypothetical protein [Xanthomonas campestris]MEA9842810.1 hypothetical protein [Xanthomonas campestris pv. raphani]WDL32771.1 hypothetical protein JH255_13345 [Xanthomonas campestris pv. campestris]WDL60148.1 hypothetical protein JH303_08445 [Xanthomonas campestris pv. campestris]
MLRKVSLSDINRMLMVNLMDLSLYQPRKLSEVALGGLLFYRGTWQLKVRQQDGALALLSLTGPASEPTLKIIDDEDALCSVFIDEIEWFCDADMFIGKQPAPNNRSIVMGASGLLICASPDGNSLYFDLKGNQSPGRAARCAVFNKWSMRARKKGESESWLVTHVQTSSAGSWI